MKIKPFELEKYFAKYEFSAPYLLSCSDAEPLTLKELLELADDETTNLWNNLWLGYTESKGHPELLKEIAKFYKNIDVGNTLEVVPEEGIFIAMNVLLENGDHIVTTFPGYQSLYEIANSLECKVSHWAPHNNRGQWSFKIADLKKQITNRTKLIVINFPHNPTGATISKDELNQLISIAKDNGIFIFSDEMYRLLEYDEAEQLPSVSDLYENSLSLCGMSKTFAMAGIRIGWLTTQNKGVFNGLATFKDYTTICGSAPSEILALMGLRAKDKIVERNKEIILKNLDILNKFFEKHTALLEWFPPKAGTIGFPKLKLETKIIDFYKDLVDKKGVMLLPADVYGFKGNYFRIGFGRRNMTQALDKLEDYIEENL